MSNRGLVLTLLLLSQGTAPVAVDPVDLAHRRDLIGREVVVDDRIRLIQPRSGRGPLDEILLKRTNVPFRLPPSLRYSSPPKGKTVSVRGILRSDGDSLVCDVTAAPNLMPDDIQRLEAGVAALAPADVKGRNAWADWGLARASAYHDEDLKKKAEEVRQQAFGIEIEQAAGQGSDKLLGLAREARRRGVAEPEPSALAHRAFRKALDATRTSADFEKIARDVVEFFPGSDRPVANGGRRPPARYERDPADGYRGASEEDRLALNRRLLTDAWASALARRTPKTPAEWIALADEARAKVPERPELGAGFRAKGLETSAADPTNLRRDEVQQLARTFRDELHQPDTADRILRLWLDHYREQKLGPIDAEGRVDTAELYLQWLKDEAMAASLLRKALEIDPQSPGAVRLFRQMGYVKDGDDWRKQTVATATPGAPTGRGDDPFLGLTTDEVIAKLGKPDRVCRVATQGKLSIQWTYSGTKGAQYLDFSQRLGDPQPIVIGRFIGH